MGAVMGKASASRPLFRGFLWVFMVWGLSVAPAVEAQDARGQWQALNQDVVRGYQEGHYQDAIALAERAYQLAQQAFGPRDPDTLISMNNLAFLYESQGRYGEAEPLYAEALALRRAVLGKQHPQTLTSTGHHKSVIREARPLGWIVALRHWKGAAVGL